ncbi:MAG: hypothetical protein VW268_15590 [Rhodospirillaceae bacterium]
MNQATYQNIPDSAGMNAFTVDPAIGQLLRVYLSFDALNMVLPRMAEMGGLADGRLEVLALTADKNPPVLHVRARDGRPTERIVKHPAY